MRRARLSTVSDARFTSEASFMLRPMPRAAVVARPACRAHGPAAEQRAEQRRAHRDGGLHLLVRGLLLLALDRLSARRSRSVSAACFAAYFFRTASSASSRALAGVELEPDPEVALRFAGS